MNTNKKCLNYEFSSCVFYAKGRLLLNNRQLQLKKENVDAVNTLRLMLYECHSISVYINIYIQFIVCVCGT